MAFSNSCGIRLRRLAVSREICARATTSSTPCAIRNVMFPELSDASKPERVRPSFNSHSYANSTGLPHPQHYSTAQDLALLAAAVIRDFPEHYAL